MNYYKVEVETGYFDEGTDTAECSQQTFYLASSKEIDFKYITRFVYSSCGEHHDQIDIFVEKMADNEKF